MPPSPQRGIPRHGERSTRQGRTASSDQSLSSSHVCPPTAGLPPLGHVWPGLGVLGLRCYRGKDPGHPHCKERPTEVQEGWGCHQTCCLTDRPTALPPRQPSGGHLWSVLPHLPTDRMVISALASSLGGPGWVGQESGSRSGGSCGLRGQQHLGPLLWLQREQQGPRVKPGPARCGAGDAGRRAACWGARDSLWRTQAGGSQGGAGPGDSRSDRRGNEFPGASPQRQAEHLRSGALPCPPPGQRPVAGLHQLLAVVLLQQLLQRRAFSVGSCSQHLALGSQGGPVPTPTLPTHPSPAPAVCLFPPQLTEQERAAPPATPGQRARLPEKAPAGRGRAPLGAGWGQTSLLTFLLCGSGAPRPRWCPHWCPQAGRQGWSLEERENHQDSRKKRVGPSPCSPASGLGSRGRPRPGCAPRVLSSGPELLPPSLLSATAPAAPGAERFQGL